MEIRRLKEFLILADVLSISGAAKILEIGQPVLSRHLMDLELELGVVLFNRKHGLGSLTQGGKLFANLAKRCVEIADSIGSHQEEKSIQRINLGLTPGLTPANFPDRIRIWCSEYPDIHVHIIEAAPAILQRALLEKEIDLAVLGIVHKASDQRLSYVKIEEIGLMLAAGGPISPGAYGGGVKRLRNAKFIGLDEHLFPGFNEIVRNLGGQEDFLQRIVTTTTGLFSQVEMIRAGLGIAVVPSSVIIHSDRNIRFLPLSTELKLDCHAVTAVSEDRSHVLRLRAILSSEKMEN